MPYADPAAAKERNRRYYRAHADEIKARVKAADDPERKRSYNKRYAAANRERLRLAAARRYRAKRDEHNRKSASARKRRREREPDVVRALDRAKAATRRARQQRVTVEKVDPLAIWQRDKGVCRLCGLPADATDWHLDHIVPIARGGSHSRDNVQVAHPFCNRSKGAKPCLSL